MAWNLTSQLQSLSMACSSVCVLLSHWPSPAEKSASLSISLPPAHMMQTCGVRLGNTLTHSCFGQIAGSFQCGWPAVKFMIYLEEKVWSWQSPGSYFLVVVSLLIIVLPCDFFSLLLSPLPAIMLPEAADTEVYTCPDISTAPSYCERFSQEPFFHRRRSSSLLF